MDERLDVTVLYVEDDQVIASLTETKLKKMVKECHIAQNGLEGLELFMKYRPDILITDLNMPEMDGITMMGKIREIDKNVRIIVTSAYDEVQTITDSVALGIDRYLIKPVAAKMIDDAIRKTAQSVLEARIIYEAHQHFEAIISAYIVSKADTDGNITFVNDNLCKISGFTKDELIGHHYKVLWHDDNKSGLEDEIKETLKQNRVWNGILKYKTKNGGYFITNTTVFHIFDKDGNTKEFLVLRQDITELENLREKQKKLEFEHEVSRVKDSFLVMFTHELKTPLNAIINFTDYVLEKIEGGDCGNPKKLAELLGSVKRNAKYMLETVTNLLDVAKLKSKKLHFDKKIFNLNAMVHSLVESYSSLTKEKNIDVVVKENENVLIKSDEMRMKQIFSNIYSNAIKYGGNKILISIGSSDKGFLLSIEDNGRGIKDKERVFELYTQDKNLLTREAEGSGVGLHLVKLLCEEMKFDLELEDSLLGGACFKIKGRSE